MKVVYIVYDKTTFLINETFESYGKDIHYLIKDNENLAWINITAKLHKETKEILNKINSANNTNY